MASKGVLKAGLFEPVLSSRPRGKRGNRARSLVNEVGQSRLLPEGEHAELGQFPQVGDGKKYLQEQIEQQLELPRDIADEAGSESISASLSATVTTTSNGDGGGGGLDCFDETGLSVDIGEFVVPRAPRVEEPFMIGPHVHFRQITEQDQDACKLRRAAASVRSMMASESEATGADATLLKSSSKQHVPSCLNDSFLNGHEGTRTNNKGGFYKIVATSSRLVMDVLESHGFKRLPGSNLPAPPPANGKPRKGKGGKEWSLLWSGKHLPVSFYRSNILSPHQRVNVFPSAFECTKKDALSRNLNRMAQVHGKRHFKFATESYTLPCERQDLLEAMTGSPGAWIVKPAGSSQGKGIYIIEGACPSSPSGSPSPPRKNATAGGTVNGSVNEDSCNSVRRKRNYTLRALPVVELAKQLPDCSNAKDNFVVERYIHSPYLIDSRKFDLRLYVVVTSFEPLKVYLHKEGLIRLASCVYSTASGSFGDRYSHLTNYSINKNHSGGVVGTPVGSGRVAAGGGATRTPFEAERVSGGRPQDGMSGSEAEAEADQAVEELGIKLRLSELGPRMGISEEAQSALWSKIEDLVIKTFISIESKVCVSMRTHCPLPEACFELFGFDVLIDADINPWLIEVNFAPSLATDTPLDFEVKSAVLADTFTLCGVRKTPMAGAGAGESRKAYGKGTKDPWGPPKAPQKLRRSPTPAASSVSGPGPDIGSPVGGGGGGDGILLASGLIDMSLLAAPVSEKEKKLVNTFRRECRRAQQTGFRLIYPRHGPEAAHYLPFLEEGKEAAMQLSHYMFTLRANPSEAPQNEGEGEGEGVDEGMRGYGGYGCEGGGRGVITAGDLPPGEFSPSALRRFTAAQISAAREEVRRQESAWRKAIGKTASVNDIY